MSEGGSGRLGRGLSALLGDEGEDYADLDKVRDSKPVPIEFLQPSAFQPRRRFNEEDMATLVASVKEKGILQPILVRRHPTVANRFEIVAGERRWRAAQRAQLVDVPVVIKDLSDQDTLEIALIENIQRESLTPLEEAEGYRRLMDEFSHTQDALARTVGKSRSHVANTLRLLVLPEPVKQLVDVGKLTAGHARALIGSDDPEMLAQQIVKRGLNVRQTERLAQSAKSNTGTARPAPQKDADTLALEREISTLLGLRVNIRFSRGGGTLTIAYKTLEQLDDVLHRLNQGGAAGRGKNMSMEERHLAALEELAGDDSEPVPADVEADAGAAGGGKNMSAEDRHIAALEEMAGDDSETVPADVEADAGAEDGDEVPWYDRPAG